MAIVQVWVLLCGCGQLEPGPSRDTCWASGSDDRFPLVDGATWTYRHTDALGVVWDESAEIKAELFQGEQAFRVQDNENLRGFSGQSILVRRDSRVLRLHTDVMQGGALVSTIDYDPGFLRWDDAWLSFVEPVLWTHTRTETNSLGGVKEKVIDYEFTVIATSVEVAVPAGTFETIQVERIRLDTFEIKQYWHAAGVGKVREETPSSGGVEELVACAIP